VTVVASGELLYWEHLEQLVLAYAIWVCLVLLNQSFSMRNESNVRK